MTFPETDWEEVAQPAAAEFIREHQDEDPAQIALRFAGAAQLPVAALSRQIELQQRAQRKLPHFARSGFLFERRALEQCSSEATARYKARFMKGQRLIDLTGGLGIDAIHLATGFDEIIYCEEDPDIARLFSVNLRKRATTNITIRAEDGLDVLRGYPDQWFDWIYADPARRTDDQRHVALDRCRPDLTRVADVLLSKARQTCIKASPALEPSSVATLAGLSELRVISVHGECREMLLLLSTSGPAGPVRIGAELIDTSGETVFQTDGPRAAGSRHDPAASIGGFFFDPDPAIIRAGLTAQVARQFGFAFVNATTDYLTGTVPPAFFPGRSFRVISCIDWHRAQVRHYLRERGIAGASIARRDFPLGPEQLRRLFRLREDDREYLFFTQDDRHMPVCIHAQRV